MPFAHHMGHDVMNNNMLALGKNPLDAIINEYSTHNMKLDFSIKFYKLD